MPRFVLIAALFLISCSSSQPVPAQDQAKPQHRTIKPQKPINLLPEDKQHREQIQTDLNRVQKSLEQWDTLRYNSDP